MKKLILILIVLNVLIFAQTRKVETDTLKARKALKIQSGATWKDRTSFFNSYLTDANKVLKAGLAFQVMDSSTTLAKISDSLGVLFVADTSALKNLVSKVSRTAYMPGLNSSSNPNNGGGLFTRKSSGSADHVTSFTATGGGIWKRAELAYSPDVNVEWSGATPDDGTDDYAAIVSAYAAALSLGGNVFLPNHYRSSATIVITPEGSSYTTGVRRPYLTGRGKLYSSIYFYNNTNGIWFNGGLSQGGWLTDPGIIDLEIRGNDAVGTSGVIFDSTGMEILQRSWIRDWYYGVKIIQCNSLFGQSNRIQDNVYGVYATTSPNEMTWASNYITNNSNKGFYQNSGNGTWITGGQIAHTDTSVHVTNGAPVYIYNVAMEGAGYYGVYVDNSGRVTLDGVSVNYSTVVNPKGNLALYVNNGFADVQLLAHPGISSDTSIYLAGTNAFVTCGPQHSNLLTIWKPTTVEYLYSLSSMRPLSSSTISNLGTQARWGNFFKLHQRPSVMSEVPFYVAKMISGDYYQAPLLNGTDQRVSLNAPTATPGLDIYPLRMVHGYVNFAFPIDADSIKNFTVKVDTAGWNLLIDAGCFVDYNQPADTTKNFAYRSWIADYNSAAGTGTLLFCVDWSQSATLPTSSITYVLRWWAVIRPNRWVQ